VNLDQENGIKKRGQLPSWLMLPFLLIWGGLMLFWAYRSVEEWQARNAVLKFLDAPDDQFAVRVNGGPAPNGRAVLQAMRSAHLRMASFAPGAPDSRRDLEEAGSAEADAGTRLGFDARVLDFLDA